jgi:succinylarginine dihydrolase
MTPVVGERFVQESSRRMTKDSSRSRHPADQEARTMDPVSRRGFIKTTGVAAAAAGAVAAGPGAVAGASTSTDDKKHLAATRTPAGAELNETVVAHLRDLHDGKIAVFVGDREITITDKRLAALLFNATR